MEREIGRRFTSGAEIRDEEDPLMYAQRVVEMIDGYVGAYLFSYVGKTFFLPEERTVESGLRDTSEMLHKMREMHLSLLITMNVYRGTTDKQPQDYLETSLASSRMYRHLKDAFLADESTPNWLHFLWGEYVFGYEEMTKIKGDHPEWFESGAVVA